MDASMDKNTIIEENIRRLRGISFLLSRLASSDNLDPDEEHMFAFLSDAIESIGNELEAAIGLEE